MLSRPEFIEKISLRKKKALIILTLLFSFLDYIITIFTYFLSSTTRIFQVSVKEADVP